MMLAFGYDARGRLTAFTDDDERQTEIARDSAGQPTAIVGPQRDHVAADRRNGYLTDRNAGRPGRCG